MWRASARLLLQLKHSRALQSNPPLRILTHNGRLAPCLSSAAEVATSAHSAQPEADPPRMEPDMAPAADTPTSPSLSFEGEQGENALMKIVGEHRQLFSALRAELELQKTLTASLLEEVRALSKKPNAKPLEAEPPGGKKLRWPEWTAFLEALKDSGYLRNGNGTPSADGGGSSTFEDLASVKKAILKFSQAHRSIIQYLSQIDLRIVARHGCAVNDSDAAVSQKILRRHFHLDHLSEESDDKPANVQLELSNVTVLLYSIILEGTAEDDVIFSIRFLLREIISLSRKPREASPPVFPSQSLLNMTETTVEGKNKESSKLRRVPDEKEKAKKSDIFLDENSLHSGKGGAKQESKAGLAPQWRCPRCSFLNLDTKHRCVECSRRRPQRTYTDDSAKINDDLSVAADDSTEEGAHKASEKGQGCGNVKDDSMVFSDSEAENNANNDVKKVPKTKNPFDVLDEILDSDESDEDELSVEPPREKGRGSNKKGRSLSGLLSKPPKKDFEQRNDLGTSRKTFNGTRQLSRDPKRRISLSTDEDDSSSSDMETLSGKGFDDLDDEGEDKSQRFGKEKRSSGRGGGGSRRNWGDSYDERSSEKGSRRSREFGERERGSRANSFDTRESVERDRRPKSENASRFSRSRSRY